MQTISAHQIRVCRAGRYRARGPHPDFFGAARQVVRSANLKAVQRRSQARQHEAALDAKISKAQKRAQAEDAWLKSKGP